MVGGGSRGDIGYREVTATPLVLLFGHQGVTCETGNSGVASVQLGVSEIDVSQATQPITATVPTSWTTVTLPTPCTTAPCQPFDLHAAQRDHSKGDSGRHDYTGSCPFECLPAERTIDR